MTDDDEHQLPQRARQDRTTGRIEHTITVHAPGIHAIADAGPFTADEVRAMLASAGVPIASFLEEELQRTPDGWTFEKPAGGVAMPLDVDPYEPFTIEQAIVAASREYISVDEAEKLEAELAELRHKAELWDAHLVANPPGCMTKIRDVRGVRLKDGREMVDDGYHHFVMYDDGVQEEDDGGATLFDWPQVAEVLL